MPQDEATSTRGAGGRAARAGRKPRRLAPEVVRILDTAAPAVGADGLPAFSPAELADQINSLEPPPVGPGGGRWNGAAVTRAIHSLRQQRLSLLRHLGPLLAEIGARQPMTVGAWVRACSNHRIDPYWIWDRFQRDDLELDEWDDPPAALVAVDYERREVTLSPRGARTLKLWEEVERHTAGVLDVLVAMDRNDGRMGVEALARACECFETASEELLRRQLVRFDDGNAGFVLTRAGEHAASAWYLSTHQDDEGRWDAGFWPEPIERDLLPENWDWSERPPLPPETKYVPTAPQG
jgi:hypothetical protein